MAFYELQYETGAMSVAEYADDTEATQAINYFHDRLAGERIVAVYVYSKHPDGYNPDETMSADVAGEEVAGLIAQATDENGVLNTRYLGELVIGLSHPMLGSATQVGESSYKMASERTLVV
jgi:hypothetical protein